MTDDVIKHLVKDLRPAEPRWPLSLVLMLWLCASAIYVGAMAAVIGPFRTGVVDQLANHPRFIVEMIAGLSAAVLFALAGFRGSIPGYPTRWISLAAAISLAIWLAHFVLGSQLPVLEPSMLGKRAHCAIEAYLYSVPPTLAAFWLQRRRFALRPLRALLHVTLAAGLYGALIMQVACMYEPEHILKYHALPIALLTAAVTATYWVLRRVKETHKHKHD